MEVIYKRDTVDRMPIIKWENMKADSEGVPIECANMKILSVSFDGKFMGGCEVVLEGAIDETFFLLMSRNGKLVNTRRPMITTVDGRYVKVRPRVLGGSDDTDITVTILGQNVR